MPFKKYVTRLGWRKVGQNDENVWHRGKSSKPKNDVTPSKIYCFKICVLINWRVLSKISYWHFDVVVRLRFVNRICTFQKMLYLKFAFYFDSFTAQSLSLFWEWQEGRGPRRKNIKCNIGEEGSKMTIFLLTSFINFSKHIVSF